MPSYSSVKIQCGFMQIVARLLAIHLLCVAVYCQLWLGVGFVIVLNSLDFVFYTLQMDVGFLMFVKCLASFVLKRIDREVNSWFSFDFQ